MAELINTKRLAHKKAIEIATEGANRGFIPVDLFAALAQIVADRNPEFGFEVLRALEQVVKAKPALEANGHDIIGDAEAPLSQ